MITTERPIRLVSGTIRNRGQGWELLNDAGHRPAGISAVITRDDHIEIQHSVGAVRVSSFQVTPDETYAAQGLRVGISVGLALSRIYLYTGAGCATAPAAPAAPAAVAATNGNLWITGLLETA